ncbi:uncharacterized protein IL334_000897 [Kwoniella shivajii]|uniref:U6 small nuclear RNA (adenine-(43)-N(6))-methyltransferase n=1 Tax=Kwoniella shivajii TaxID=564305 RepID=A0ABZ1CQF9_9TREE|nr:hypothetical protein IL334_000897 [Kwoniella shivajii]
MHRDNPYLIKKPDFARLASRFPDFAQYVNISEDGAAYIDFQDASALRSLTRCLLRDDWDLEVNFREDRLCPTLANRLDYLLHILDLEPHLPSSSSSRLLRVLDIGTGASAIYPILLLRLRPNAIITATELDETSYNHSLSVLAQNDIPSTSINILQAPSSDPILFPILNEEDQWDITICNPPFFGSEEEIKQGQEGKEHSAHSAPTASMNELITPGGEVAFVGKMIKESMKIGDRCRWYTSLIGKYSSLSPLVELLKVNKIDNYLLKNIRQSKTTRWILGWSHCSNRLPDNLARPEDVISNTSFSRLLPHPNTFHHKPQPSIPLEELKEKILQVLQGIQLDHSSVSHQADCQEADDKLMYIQPMINTWSRSARRAVLRQQDQATTTPASLINANETSDTPLFKARISFIPPLTAKDHSSISLDWMEGRDRTMVEGLWKFLLSKAELIGKKKVVDSGYGGRLGSGVWERGRGRAGKSWSKGRAAGREKHGEEEEEGLNEGRRYGQRRRLG